MPRQVFDFDPPDRFVAGTVGQPGERTFYLQATGRGRIVSVALEKVQVAALAERLDELLDEIRRREGDDSDIPVTMPSELEDMAPLDAPIEEEFRVATLALAWDGDERKVAIEALAGTVDEEEAQPFTDTDDGPDVMRVALPPALARAFAKRAKRVVAAGRPPCPLCGNPLDPTGHVCPRQNGHHAVQ